MGLCFAASEGPSVFNCTAQGERSVFEAIACIGSEGEGLGLIDKRGLDSTADIPLGLSCENADEGESNHEEDLFHFGLFVEKKGHSIVAFLFLQLL